MERINYLTHAGCHNIKTKEERTAERWADVALLPHTSAHYKGVMS
jgi:hypothetical protein